MSDESKKPEAFSPKTPSFTPFWGLDLARELGSLDSRLGRVENDIQKMDAKIDVVEYRLTAKIEAVDARVDKCLVAINRLDERMVAMEKRFDDRLTAISKTTHTFGAAVLAAVLAGIILQYFPR
ncbi:MAG: hypothetical protein LBV79_00300 [Candidatus Adiutrix sp.]|nr:hypothetical protein [Candidatus Adiutrix sp.]